MPVICRSLALAWRCLICLAESQAMAVAGIGVILAAGWLWASYQDSPCRRTAVAGDADDQVCTALIEFATQTLHDHRHNPEVRQRWAGLLQDRDDSSQGQAARERGRRSIETPGSGPAPSQSQLQTEGAD